MIQKKRGISPLHGTVFIPDLKLQNFIFFPCINRKQFLEMEDHVHNSMEEFVDNSVDNVENC